MPSFLRGTPLVLLLLSIFICLCSRSTVRVDNVSRETVDLVQVFPPEPEVVKDPCIDGLFIPVLFEFDCSVVDSLGMVAIGAVAGYMRECGGVVVEVGGYCDERGSEEYNFGLGERRALAVRGILEDMGVHCSRVGVVSYGEGGLKKSACGADEGCHAQNRRVEFVFNELEE
jgi:outer membrane protein OmpA-like peptidoglycan-associated protein